MNMSQFSSQSDTGCQNVPSHHHQNREGRLHSVRMTAAEVSKRLIDLKTEEIYSTEQNGLNELVILFVCR